MKTWFITGASKGLGLSLTKQLLALGDQVAATSRDIKSLKSAVSSDSGNFLPLQVDLSDESNVQGALDETIQKFGRIDVLVNNAGYGIGGSIEELTDNETRTAFDVNVFGTFNTIRKVMPFLRKQRSGHIINISSIAGITGASGWAVYAASKFAVIGLTEVLAEDVRSFGIHVTVVAPGAFRTSFLSDESLILAKNQMEEYETVRASHAKFLKMNGHQAGDPEKAVAALIKLAADPNPPIRLLLGTDAFTRAMDKQRLLDETYKSQESLTKSTDY